MCQTQFNKFSLSFLMRRIISQIPELNPRQICRDRGHLAFRRRFLGEIGAGKAEEIIRYRERNGRFKRPEDLMKVPGIKEKAYERVKDSITV